jgi:hypothetical protein
MIAPHKFFLTTYLLVAPIVEYIVNLREIKNKRNESAYTRIFNNIQTEFVYGFIWPSKAAWSRLQDRLTFGRNVTLTLEWTVMFLRDIYTGTWPTRLEFLHPSFSSRQRRRKGNPLLGCKTGSPCSWGEINMGTWASRLGESQMGQKIFVTASVWLVPFSDCTENCRPVLSWERAPKRDKATNFRQQHPDRKLYLIVSSTRVLDTKTYWLIVSRKITSKFRLLFTRISRSANVCWALFCWKGLLWYKNQFFFFRESFCRGRWVRVSWKRGNVSVARLWVWPSTCEFRWLTLLRKLNCWYL